MDLTVITSSPREPRLRLPEPNKFKKCGPVKYGTRTRLFTFNFTGVRKVCTLQPTCIALELGAKSLNPESQEAM
jgi:hypothetical protein